MRAFGIFLDKDFWTPTPIKSERIGLGLFMLSGPVGFGPNGLDAKYLGAGILGRVCPRVYKKGQVLNNRGTPN